MMVLMSAFRHHYSPKPPDRVTQSPVGRHPVQRRRPDRRSRVTTRPSRGSHGPSRRGSRRVTTTTVHAVSVLSALRRQRWEHANGDQAAL